MPRDLLAERQPKQPQEFGPAQPGFRLNMQRGEHPIVRAWTSVKTTPEGLAGALESLGREVLTDKTGRVFIVDREKGEIYPVDPEGFQPVGDIASVTGEAIEAVPSLTGPGKITSQAARGGVGSALRQGVSSALPGKDYPSVLDTKEAMSRGGQVVEAAALAGGSQGLVNVGGGALRAILNPSRFVGRRMQALEKTPEAQRGRTIESRTGVGLTPGQRTQTKSLLTIEGMLRRHPGTADIVESLEAKQMSNALRSMDRTLDTLTRANASPEAVGNAVRAGFGRVLDTALDIRSKQGRVDFGLVENLASQAGNRNIIATPNTQSAVKELIDEMAIEGATPAVIRPVIRELRQVGDLLGRSQGQAIPPRTMQQLLQLWGKAAQGTGRVFKDIDRGQEKMIASRVFGALQRDLDEAAQAAGDAGPVSQALRAARDNWKTNSQAVGELRDSTLSRFVGADALVEKDPEAIAQALLKAKPSALRGSMEILNRADPDLAQQVKRYAFEDALEKAGRPLSANVPAIASVEEVFSPARFVTAMKRSPVWDVLTPQEQKRLAIDFELFGRIARKAGTEGSPTAPLMFAWDLVKAVGGQVGRLDLTSAGATLSGVISARRIAELMFDPKASAALRATFSTKTPNPRKARALVLLSSLLAADEIRGGEDVRPDTEEMIPGNPQRQPRDLLEGQ